MPEMDGSTASRIIKQDLREKAPYIIACTADLQYDTRSACDQAGIDNYLEKVRCLLPYSLTGTKFVCLSSHTAAQAEGPCAGARKRELSRKTHVSCVVVCCVKGGDLMLRKCIQCGCRVGYCGCGQISCLVSRTRHRLLSRTLRPWW